MNQKRAKERQLRETGMIKAAETVFCRNGYEAASMDEIAKAAQFTKRTLYQYFESKDELFCAVVLKGYELLASKQESAKKYQKSGYEKVECAINCYYEFYRDCPDLSHLMSGWSHVSKQSECAGRWNEALAAFFNKLIQDVKSDLEAGKFDGSIEPDVDSQKIACSFVFLMDGFFHQLSSSGEIMIRDSFTDAESFNCYITDFLLKTIKRNRSILVTRKGTV